MFWRRRRSFPARAGYAPDRQCLRNRATGESKKIGSLWSPGWARNFFRRADDPGSNAPSAAIHSLQIDAAGIVVTCRNINRQRRQQRNRSAPLVTDRRCCSVADGAASAGRRIKANSSLRQVIPTQPLTPSRTKADPHRSRIRNPHPVCRRSSPPTYSACAGYSSFAHVHTRRQPDLSTF